MVRQCAGLREKYKPRVYRNPAWVNRHKKMVQARNKVINNRKPEDWVIMVNNIEEPGLRRQVACIVWWDYFAVRPKEKGYWAHLDEFITEEARPEVFPNKEDVLWALIRVGLPFRTARRRLEGYGQYELKEADGSYRRDRGRYRYGNRAVYG